MQWGCYVHLESMHEIILTQTLLLKIMEPFPPGWTTFVVSAPIPYQTLGVNQRCDETLTYDSGSVCFLERVEFYYPEGDNKCDVGCPHCHDCPLLKLGDRFGPLEVVGFGHESLFRDKNDNFACASCDKQVSKSCDRQRDCKDWDWFHCDEMTDCKTGEPLGLPSFYKNECSFVVP